MTPEDLKASLYVLAFPAMGAALLAALKWIFARMEKDQAQLRETLQRMEEKFDEMKDEVKDALRDHEARISTMEKSGRWPALRGGRQ